MKKNGRLVAIALGSVLCASCVGGAFLVAGNAPAAETVRAADAETLTYEYSAPNNNYQNDLDQFLTDTVVLNGKTWKNSHPVNFVTISGTKTKRYFQLGKSKDPFTGTTLSISTNDLLGENFCVKEIELDFAMSGSALDGPVVTFAVDGTQIGQIESVDGLTNNNGHVVNTTASEELSGLLEITFAGRSKGALMLHSITVTGEKIATEPVSYDHIGFVGELNKTEYFVGDAFTLDGVSIYAYPTAEDVDGVDVTDEAVFIADPDVFSEPGEGVEVYVYATFGELEAETTFSVNVNPDITAESLTVSGLEEDKVYSVGDIVDFSLVKITAHMSDGSDYDATYDLALEPYTITLEDAYKGSVEFPLEFKGVTTSIVLSTELSNIESVRVADEGAKVSTKGLVTGKFSHSGGYSIFIEDEGHAIMLYGIPTTLSESVAVGDIIAVSGSKTDYNGLVEIEDVDGLYIASTGNEANPTIIDDVTTSALTDWDSRYIQVSGLTKNSGSLWTDSNRSTLVVKHSSGTIGFYCSNDQIAEDLQYQLDDFFTKIDNLSFTFTGHVGWFKTSAQLNPTSIDEFSCPDYDAVMAFINSYMKPNISQSDEGDGKSCLEWYPAAKAALEALTETQRNFFLTSDATAAYANRYNNWAKAYGEGATSSLGTIMGSNDTAAIIALVALSSATVAAAGFMIASRRRKAK